MDTGLASQGSRRFIASILFVALALRALVPVGFMPAADRPFALEICPDGFPPQLLHYGMSHGHGMHHPGGASHFHDAGRSEHCVFAAVAGAGPATHALVVHLPLSSSLVPLFDTAGSVFPTPRFRIQQPRAPPAPA
jgi:hypothetical protein